MQASNQEPKIIIILYRNIYKFSITSKHELKMSDAYLIFVFKFTNLEKIADNGQFFWSSP